MPEFHDEQWADNNPHDWVEPAAWLWDDLTDGRGWGDEYGQFLFDAAFVDPLDSETRGSVLDALREWVDQEYGIDFDDAFDWAAWREWYE